MQVHLWSTHSEMSSCLLNFKCFKTVLNFRNTSKLKCKCIKDDEFTFPLLTDCQELQCCVLWNTGTSKCHAEVCTVDRWSAMYLFTLFICTIYIMSDEIVSLRQKGKFCASVLV